MCGQSPGRTIPQNHDYLAISKLARATTNNTTSCDCCCCYCCYCCCYYCFVRSLYKRSLSMQRYAEPLYAEPPYAVFDAKHCAEHRAEHHIEYCTENCSERYTERHVEPSLRRCSYLVNPNRAYSRVLVSTSIVLEYLGCSNSLVGNYGPVILY